MTRRPLSATLLVAAILTLYGAAASARAESPPPGTIQFRAANAIAQANGQFRSWRVARATIDDREPWRSEVEVVVDLASVDTDSPKRDAHLRNADFFDVERYPTATATLRRFTLLDAERFAADVTLDLHGRTKTFPMIFRIVDREQRRIAGEATLNRMDFGVGSPKSALNPLSIDEEVALSVQATVPPAGKPAAAGTP